MNWEEACQILGVPITATPAEIRAQFNYKAQLLHPDKTGGLPESVRQKAEEELKLVIAAYNVLKDPKNNPQVNPPKLNVSPRHIRFKDVEPNKKKTTTIEIESVGGAYTKFWMDDSPAAWLKVIEVKSTTNEPLPLEVTIEATGSSTLRKRIECSLPIRIENEKSKTKDEVTVKIELQMKSATRPHAFSFLGIKIRNLFTKLRNRFTRLWNRLTRLWNRFIKPKPSPMHIPRPTHPKQVQKIFVVSDTHFDHTNIIRYANRPFTYPNKSPNVEAMNWNLVNNWNHAVGRNDLIFFLGDFVYGRNSRPPGYWLKRLNGRKIMIRGSHDRNIRTNKHYEVLNYNGIRFFLVHDPKDIGNWNGWVIHGHHHRDNNGNIRHPFIDGRNKLINVNVELTGYKPVNLDYLCSLGLDTIKWMDTINSTPYRW